jgi:hypothetical protein
MLSALGNAVRKIDQASSSSVREPKGLDLHARANFV